MVQQVVVAVFSHNLSNSARMFRLDWLHSLRCWNRSRLQQQNQSRVEVDKGKREWLPSNNWNHSKPRKCRSRQLNRFRHSKYRRWQTNHRRVLRLVVFYQNFLCLTEGWRIRRTSTLHWCPQAFQTHYRSGKSGLEDSTDIIVVKSFLRKFSPTKTLQQKLAEKQKALKDANELTVTLSRPNSNSKQRLIQNWWLN